METFRYIAYSTISGFPLAYGDSAQDACDSAVEGMKLRSSDHIEVVDCGASAPVIWQEMTRLELVRPHRSVVWVDGFAKRVLPLLALGVLLSACGPGSAFQARVACHRENGPEPYAAGHAFGLIGGLITAAQPEHIAWQDRFDACVAQSLAVAKVAP